MFRRHYLLAAALISTAGAASAQTTPAQPAPPASPPIMAPAPTAAMPATPPTTAGQLRMDQYLGSKLDGANVYNPADEKIADVADVVFSDQGQVVSVILGYGGVAGIGRSYVAVQPNDLKVRRASADSSDLRVQTSMTLDDLKRAPQFSYTERTR